MECYKCHKKGHYANKCPEIKAKEVRFSDLGKDTKDPFMRYWVILSNLGQLRIGPENKGYLEKVFVDTGADCNTISRKFYEIVVSQGLKRAFYPGPSKGVKIYLVGE